MLTTRQTRFDAVYRDHMEMMVTTAREIAGDEAEDIAHDTLVEVMSLPELPEGNIEGLLRQRVKWRAHDALRRRGAILESDLGDTEDGDDLRPMQLEDLEAVQLQHGTIPPWPSAVDHDTPEEIVSANQLRDIIRTIALERAGATDYAMFLAVVVDGTHQARVAKEFKVDQTTVSRSVARVRDVVATGLMERGINAF